MNKINTLYADRSGGPDRWETFWYNPNGTKRYGKPCYGKTAVMVYSKCFRFKQIVFIGDEVIKINSY